MIIRSIKTNILISLKPSTFCKESNSWRSIRIIRWQDYPSMVVPILKGWTLSPSEGKVELFKGLVTRDTNQTLFLFQHFDFLFDPSVENRFLRHYNYEEGFDSRRNWVPWFRGGLIDGRKGSCNLCGLKSCSVGLSCQWSWVCPRGYWRGFGLIIGFGLGCFYSFDWTVDRV